MHLSVLGIDQQQRLLFCFERHGRLFSRPALVDLNLWDVFVRVYWIQQKPIPVLSIFILLFNTFTTELLLELDVSKLLLRKL